MSESRETLEEALRQAKISNDWMLKTIRHKADETSGGNYSDELKHAIQTQEMLEKITESEESK